jgi:hypothetical protein
MKIANSTILKFPRKQTFGGYQRYIEDYVHKVMNCIEDGYEESSIAKGLEKAGLDDREVKWVIQHAKTTIRTLGEIEIVQTKEIPEFPNRTANDGWRLYLQEYVQSVAAYLRNLKFSIGSVKAALMKAGLDEKEAAWVIDSAIAFNKKPVKTSLRKNLLRRAS